jgi:circadian clock protein KaiA
MLLLILLIFPSAATPKFPASAPIASKVKFFGQMWHGTDHTAHRLNFSLLITTTTAKIYYLLQWWGEFLNKNFTYPSFDVHPCPAPKPQQFFQPMTQVDRQVLLQQLKSDYRHILINYFTADKTLKEKIDKFIHAVFCANIPVPQIIEFHMELIEDFSIQLKLEGRSDEALLDYRLALIDILAHLCEYYRRSLNRLNS